MSDLIAIMEGFLNENNPLNSMPSREDRDQKLDEVADSFADFAILQSACDFRQKCNSVKGKLEQTRMQPSSSLYVIEASDDEFDGSFCDQNSFIFSTLRKKQHPILTPSPTNFIQAINFEDCDHSCPSATTANTVTGTATMCADLLSTSSSSVVSSSTSSFSSQDDGSQDDQSPSVKRCKKLSEIIDEKDSEIHSLREHLFSLQSKFESLQSSRALESTLLRDAAKVLSSIEMDRTSLQAKLRQSNEFHQFVTTQLSDTIKGLELQLASVKEQVVVLQGDRNRLEEENQTFKSRQPLQSEAPEAEAALVSGTEYIQQHQESSRIQEYEAFAEKIIQENSDLIRQSREYQRDISEYSSTIHELRGQISVLNAQLLASQQAIAPIPVEAPSMPPIPSSVSENNSEDICSLRKRNEALLQTIQSLECELRRANTDLFTSTALQEISASNNELQQQLEAIQRRLTLSENRLEEQERINRQLESQLEAATAAVTATATATATISAVISVKPDAQRSLSSDYPVNSSEFMSISQENESLRLQISVLEAQQLSLQSEIKQFKDKLQVMTRQFTTQDITLNQQQTEISTLQQEIGSCQSDANFARSVRGAVSFIVDYCELHATVEKKASIENSAQFVAAAATANSYKQQCEVQERLIGESQITINQLTRELADSQRHQMQLQSTLDNLVESRDQLQQSVSQLKNDLRGAANTIEDRDSTVQSLQEAQIGLSRQLSDIQSEFDEEMRSRKILEGDLGAKITELASMSSITGTNARQIRELEDKVLAQEAVRKMQADQIAHLQAELHLYNDQAAREHQDINLLKQQIQDLERACNQYEARTGALGKEVAEAAVLIDRLQQEKILSDKARIGLKSNLAEKEESLAEYKLQLASLSSERTLAVEQIKTLQADRQRLEQECQRLINQEKSEREVVQERLQRSQTALQLSIDSEQQLQIANSQLVVEVSSLRRQEANWREERQELEELRISTCSLSQKLESMRLENVELQKSVVQVRTDARSQHESSKAEIERMREENDKLTHKVSCKIAEVQSRLEGQSVEKTYFLTSQISAIGDDLVRNASGRSATAAIKQNLQLIIQEQKQQEQEQQFNSRSSCRSEMIALVYLIDSIEKVISVSEQAAKNVTDNLLEELIAAKMLHASACQDLEASRLQVISLGRQLAALSKRKKSDENTPPTADSSQRQNIWNSHVDRMNKFFR